MSSIREFTLIVSYDQKKLELQFQAKESQHIPLPICIDWSQENSGVTTSMHVVVATLWSLQQSKLPHEVLCLLEVWNSYPLAICQLNYDSRQKTVHINIEYHMIALFSKVLIA